jgi:parvulin-like peptidyl-prolyl isomerase
MRIVIYGLAVLLFCGWLTGCRASSSRSASTPGLADDKSPVIVEINGGEERKAAFERFVKARLSDLSQDPQNQADNDKQLSGLFDEFVQRQVILQEAKKKGIEPTDEEIRNALESQHKLTSDGADRNPTTLESGERRIEIFSDLVVRNFHEKAGLLKDVKVTPQEIEDYYNKNSDRYQSKNGFYVREIRVQEDAEAQKLYRQALAKPQDFAVLAKEHSDSPTAAGGGLMLYEAQQLPPVLEQAITPLKVGSISRVVKSNYGFHIFKLEQRAEPLTLDKARKEIEETLLEEKKQAVIDDFNKRAIAEAKIKIHRDKLGFSYAGNLNTGS